MIKSKKDYKEYVCEDLKAMGRTKKNFLSMNLDWTLKFQLALRKAEYYQNCCKGFWQKPLVAFYKYRYRILGNKCGYTIPLNVCGKGLNIAHLGTIVINGGTKIGDYCRIHVGVNIGTSAGEKNAAPIIGDRVYIGPGVKIFGPINIASDIVIGANAVVNKSFVTPGVTIGGVPAKQISEKSSKGLLYAPED